LQLQLQLQLPLRLLSRWPLLLPALLFVIPQGSVVFLCPPNTAKGIVILSEHAVEGPAVVVACFSTIRTIRPKTAQTSIV
jgi:hypothetical protein